MKILAKCLGGLLGILLLLVLIAVLINLRDETLSPEAKQILEKSNVPDLPDNAAYMLWALDAPPEINAIEKGKEILGKYQRMYVDNPYRNDWPTAKGPAIVFPDVIKCSDQVDPCLTKYTSNPEIVKALAQQHPHILARFDQIETASSWIEVLPPISISSPMPDFGTLASAERLSLAIAAVDFAEGHKAEGLKRIEKTARISRRILAGSRSLIGKMVAVAMVNRITIFTAELANCVPLDTQFSESVRQWYKPFNDQERDLGVVLTEEEKLIAHVIDQVIVEGDDEVKEPVLFNHFLVKLFLKVDATKNIQAQFFSLRLPLMVSNAKEFIRLQKEIDGRFQAMKNEVSGIGFVYNPVGKILVLIRSANLYDDYVARVHDAEAILAVLRAKIAMLDAKVGAKDAQHFLDSLSIDARDPYTELPLRWNEKAQAIEVPHFSDRTVPRISVKLVQS